MKTIPIYTVDADAETGEWIGEPAATGETTTRQAWASRLDGLSECMREHYDTYEAGDETRAIIVRWKEPETTADAERSAKATRAYTVARQRYDQV